MLAHVLQRTRARSRIRAAIWQIRRTSRMSRQDYREPQIFHLAALPQVYSFPRSRPLDSVRSFAIALSSSFRYRSDPASNPRSKCGVVLDAIPR